MQAIHTKYLVPTNHSGSRIRATCAAKRITLPWDCELEVEENHRLAALALAEMIGWSTEGLVTGCLPDGSYCHVFAPRS